MRVQAFGPAVKGLCDRRLSGPHDIRHGACGMGREGEGARGKIAAIAHGGA